MYSTVKFLKYKLKIGHWRPGALHGTGTASVAMLVSLLLSMSCSDKPDPLRPASEVLPANMVSKGAMVFVGEGYLYQVRPELEIVELPDGIWGAQGDLKGMITGSSQVTVYATQESFSGSLDELVVRETEAVTAAGGKVRGSTPVKVNSTGDAKKGHRFTARIGEGYDTRIYIVHNGDAFVFHCGVAERSNWATGIAGDCAIMGATFDVDPSI